MTLLTLNVSSNANAYAYCGTKFSHAGDPRKAIARVYAGNPQLGGEFKGTAYIIDEKKGLVLTAYHVVQDSAVQYWLVFEASDGQPIQTRLVDHIPLANKTDEHGNDPYDIASDVALLRIEGEVPLGVAALELGKGNTATDELEVLGYPSGAGPFKYKMVMSSEFPRNDEFRNWKCRLLGNQQVEKGVSGSAAYVVGQDGQFILGMVSDKVAAFDYGNHNYPYALAIPTECFFDRLAEIAYKVPDKKLVDILSSNSFRQINSIISDTSFSNLEVYQAAKEAMKINRDARIFPTCLIIAGVARRLHIDPNVIVEEGRKAQNAMLNVANNLMKLAEATKKSSSNNEKVDLQGEVIAQAIAYFKEAIQLGSIDQSRVSIYKSLGDAELKLYGFTKDRSLLESAKRNLATVAVAAEDLKLKRQSLASLGLAAYQSDDLELSYLAFSGAIELGVQKRWVISRQKQLPKQIGRTFDFKEINLNNRLSDLSN